MTELTHPTAVARSAEPPSSSDCLVVGAGLVGLAVARELLLRDPGARVAVLERADHLAPHQSGHNSGVVHAGIYYAPGSLKARLAVTGAAELYRFCAEHDVPHRRSGKLIVATEPEQLAGLAELERRGKANGVPDLETIGSAAITELEPHVRGVAALHSPHTGIVDYPAMAAALAADVEAHGGTVHLGWEVAAITARAGGADVPWRPAGADAVAGVTAARRVVTCAGAWSDVLAPSRDVRILPFRGAYRSVRPERAHLVRSLIYPVPDPDLPFLGVHLTRGIDDEVHVGPTALLVGGRDAYRLARVVGRDVAHVLGWPGTWRMARRWWRTAATEVHHALRPDALTRAAAAFVPELEAGDLVAGPAGVRGQAVARDGRLLDDFLLDDDGVALHVRNAPSPAATACLALAREIVDRAGR